MGTCCSPRYGEQLGTFFNSPSYRPWLNSLTSLQVRLWEGLQGHKSQTTRAYAASITTIPACLCSHQLSPAYQSRRGHPPVSPVSQPLLLDPCGQCLRLGCPWSTGGRWCLQDHSRRLQHQPTDRPHPFCIHPSSQSHRWNPRSYCGRICYWSWSLRRCPVFLPWPCGSRPGDPECFPRSSGLLSLGTESTLWRHWSSHWREAVQVCQRSPGPGWSQDDCYPSKHPWIMPWLPTFPHHHCFRCLQRSEQGVPLRCRRDPELGWLDGPSFCWLCSRSEGIRYGDERS